MIRLGSNLLKFSDIPLDSVGLQPRLTKINLLLRPPSLIIKLDQTDHSLPKARPTQPVVVGGGGRLQACSCWPERVEFELRPKLTRGQSLYVCVCVCARTHTCVSLGVSVSVCVCVHACTGIATLKPTWYSFGQMTKILTNATYDQEKSIYNHMKALKPIAKKKVEP